MSLRLSEECLREWQKKCKKCALTNSTLLVNSGIDGRKRFELQMLANDIHQDYWVKLASYHLDDCAYKVYEQCGQEK